MASRAQQKEEARKRRLAAEQEATAKAARQRRMLMLAGTVIVAVVVIVVAVAISSGSSSTNNAIKPGKAQNATIATVSSLLSGIPQSGNTLGNPNAPVTMTYYGDLECPVCMAFTTGEDDGGFPQFIADQVKTGHVKVVYSNFETATQDPATFHLQQVAALAAGEQNKFWNYAETFYREQGEEDSGYVTESYLQGLAKQVPGLDFSTWMTDRKKSTLLEQVIDAENQGSTIGVTGTPTLIFQGPRGKSQAPEGVASYQELLSSLKQVV